MRDLNAGFSATGWFLERAWPPAEADKNLAIPVSRQWVGFSMSH
jgi:hypothetical protein